MVSMQTNVDKDQVKAAIKAQQEQQIDNVSFFYIMPKILRAWNLFVISKSIYYEKICIYFPILAGTSS